MDALLDTLRQTAVLKTCRSILTWDQETYMPRGGADLRAKQLALLSGQIHRRQASAELQRLLEEAGPGDPESATAANLRGIRRDFDLATKIPAELVEERAHVATLARRAWADARAASDFTPFQPWLERSVTIARRYADALGYPDHPYDALLDLYEPGFRTADLHALFDPLREPIARLVKNAPDSEADACLRRAFPRAGQEELARRTAEAFGFDFERGRLDAAVHPFCGGAGPWDVRITTRYDEGFLADALYSVLHEAGHGIYEQGLCPEQFGLPLGEACSSGVHESQSRLWENLVGRSRGFVAWFLPHARALFPDSLGDIDEDAFWRAINVVRPSLIRVDADEVTYNLHVFLRFELECELVAGDLAVADLPDAWNDRFEALFGIRPPDDARGCLQDIHWSAGMFGYFPTYALGNVYAAQLFERAQEDVGDLEPLFARGDFAPLKTWLNEHVHWRGRRYPPRELIERVTGAPPSPEPLLRRLERLVGPV